MAGSYLDQLVAQFAPRAPDGSIGQRPLRQPQLQMPMLPQDETRIVRPPSTPDELFAAEAQRDPSLLSGAAMLPPASDGAMLSGEIPVGSPRFPRLPPEPAPPLPQMTRLSPSMSPYGDYQPPTVSREAPRSFMANPPAQFSRPGMMPGGAPAAAPPPAQQQGGGGFFDGLRGMFSGPQYQSNSRPVLMSPQGPMPDGSQMPQQINWGDPLVAQDFFRASQQSMLTPGLLGWSG